MPLILELEKAYAAAKADPGFQREMDGYLDALCRPAVAALFCRATDGAFRRRKDLFEARGPQSHRRAQGEQRARSDHAGAAHGQEAHDRRNRRRHARRGDGHVVRDVRACNASSIWARWMSNGRSLTCSACKMLGAEVAPGAVGFEDAEGRDERGAARLGHQCRGHVLLHRHGRRAASVSDDGARLPVASSATKPASR